VRHLSDVNELIVRIDPGPVRGWNESRETRADGIVIMYPHGMGVVRKKSSKCFSTFTVLSKNNGGPAAGICVTTSSAEERSQARQTARLISNQSRGWLQLLDSA
jgi:uncharacterized protein YjlB